MTARPRRPIRLVRRRALLALALALACGTAGASERGDRIVSLGGAVTEILYALGMDGRVAAVDTTSLHPPAALATKPNVGYLRQLSAEGILSVRPTLVIAVEGAGPPDALKLVEGAGVPIEPIPDDHTEAGVRAKIRAVARLVGREPEGDALADRTDAAFRTLAVARAAIDRPVRALFILSAQNGRAMVGGRGTTADGMFALAGVGNAADAIDGYKPMSDEAIVAARPDVVVMMEVGPGGHASADILDGPALSQTPAGRDRRLVRMDGLYLLGFGPRTPDAARDLMRAVYPGLKDG